MEMEGLGEVCNPRFPQINQKSTKLYNRTRTLTTSPPAPSKSRRAKTNSTLQRGALPRTCDSVPPLPCTPDELA